MPWIIGAFGLLMAFIMMAASGDNKPKSPVQTEIHQDNCYMIPDAKKDKVADLIVQCVNNATAKQTGENQDADDWVKACGEQFKDLYQVKGYRKYTGGDMDPDYLTGCTEFPKDTLTAK